MFALRSPKAIHLLPGEHGAILGRLYRGGVGKSAWCWSTKAAITAIALKRVQIEEKLPWRAYRNSSTLFRTVPSPTPYDLLFPRLGVRKHNPKVQSLFSGTGGAIGIQIWLEHSQAHPNKSPLKILERGILGASRDCLIFLGTPYYLRNR